MSHAAMNLKRYGLATLGLMLAIATARAEVGEHYADTDDALGVARGPAAAEIRAALTARAQACTGMDFKPTRCALAVNAVNADVHYGSAEGDSRKLALVSVRWQSDPTGNVVEAKGLVFVAEPGAAFRLLGETDLIGESLRDIVFERQRITYATDYLRGGDSRGNPTGQRRYEIRRVVTPYSPVVVDRLPPTRFDHRQPQTPGRSTPAPGICSSRATFA
ncbi:hypothetical protein [Bosea sp. TND4EK4]|uniref:hypothetical protein n=1 Tax=Bosea sp. TND4EK4 TaxID=1907408 RepID=UPI000955F9FF|nr:hypothetical protein [Bosea sp. TND4EK4]SIQ36444.1 hypothetical protein SAMN05880592_102533 [Bosea sp. TND4EK4]